MSFLILFFLSLTFSNNPVEDCSCIGQATTENAFKNSDIVFWGRVDSINYVSLKETIKDENVKEVEAKIEEDFTKKLWDNQKWILKVNIKLYRMFKGVKKNQTIIIYTPSSGASCGFNFKTGKEYIVYANKKSDVYSMFAFDDIKIENLEKPNTFWTNQCTNTGSYNKEEAKILKKLSRKY